MYLTRALAKEWIPILQAFVEGKRIQIEIGIAPNGEKCYADLMGNPYSSTQEPVLPLTRSNRTEIMPYELRVL